MVRLDRLIAGRRIRDDAADRHLAGGGQLHLGIADAEDVIGIDQDTTGLEAAVGGLEANVGAIAADIRNGECHRLSVGVICGPCALPLRRIDVGKL